MYSTTTVCSFRCTLSQILCMTKFCLQWASHSFLCTVFICIMQCILYICVKFQSCFVQVTFLPMYCIYMYYPVYILYICVKFQSCFVIRLTNFLPNFRHNFDSHPLLTAIIAFTFHTIRGTCAIDKQAPSLLSRKTTPWLPNLTLFFAQGLTDFQIRRRQSVYIH